MSNILWQAKLDDRYHCSVIRTNPGRADLKVIDSENEECILFKQVKVRNDAVLGVEWEDMNEWTDMILNKVDEVASG